MELVGNEDDDVGKSKSNLRSTPLKWCEVHIWDDGKKINCIIGGINTDGTIWVRMSKDGADKIQIYNVKGENIEIKINNYKGD